MSRIGKQPIKIPEGVSITLIGQTLSVKGPKGQLSQTFNKEVEIKVDKSEIVLTIKGENRLSNSLHGLYRSLIANMVFGVVNGWNKGLELTGVGYRAAVVGNNLVLNVGYSHPVNFPIPVGITITIKENKINVTGFDKQLVGETAAQIRRVKPPEPYKGKGIHYIGEKIRRKAGKVVKAIGGMTSAK